MNNGRPVEEVTRGMHNVLIKLHCYWGLEHKVKNKVGFHLLHPDNESRRVPVKDDLIKKMSKQGLIYKIEVSELIHDYVLTTEGKKATWEYLKIYQYSESSGRMDMSEIIKRINEGLKY